MPTPPLHASPSRWQAFTHWLLKCWSDPTATPSQNAIFRAQQFHFVVQLIPLAALPSMGLVIAGAWWFWDVGDRGTVLMLSACQLFNGACSMALWHHCRHHPRSAPVADRTVWMLIATLSASALIWAALTVHLFEASSMQQRAILLSVIGAVLTCGSWFYAVLPQAALAWTFTMSVGLMVGLGITQWDSYPALPLLLLFYMVVLAWVVLLSGRMFMRSLRTELALGQQRQLVGLLLKDFEEGASDWLWEIGAGGSLRYASSRLAVIMGQPLHVIQDRRFVDLLAEVAPPGDDPTHSPHQSLHKALAEDLPFRDLTVPVMLGGQRRWWALSAKPLRDAQGALTGWRGVGSDVTIVREHTIELTRLASVDPLTGLANRYQLNQRLAAHFSMPAQVANCMLMLLDLDHFKNVNDSLGHVAGDELLCEVAQRLRAHIEPDMLLARLGGDEFALMVEGVIDLEGIKALGARLQQALVQPCVISHQRLEVQASIGVGLAPHDGNSAAGLLKASDLALYAAKAAGRNTLRFFEADMEAAARDRMEMLAEMRDGIEREQFLVHYQPQVDLRSGELLGFEALVRWQHPTRGLLQPGRFIALAEESRLIVQLGKWVLQQACHDAMTWPGELRVAVNISAVEFDRTDVTHTVTEALRQSGLPHQRLEVELTESTLLQDTESIIEVLTELRRLGVRTALDDFGTGFSSLAYLRRFPLDQLKIDQSFVRPLGQVEDGVNTRNAEAIVRAIHGLAQALGMETTAEGVETPEQLAVLRAVGCHVAQGYHYAKPMDRAQLVAYLNAHHGSASPVQVLHGTQLVAYLRSAVTSQVPAPTPPGQPATPPPGA
jgi:diguanylate cyclase (GGDEF)-like protein